MVTLFHSIVFSPTSPWLCAAPPSRLAPAWSQCLPDSPAAGARFLLALFYSVQKARPLEHLLAMRPTETSPAHPAGAEPLIKLYSLSFSVIQIGWEEASWN